MTLIKRAFACLNLAQLVLSELPAELREKLEGVEFSIKTSLDEVDLQRGARHHLRGYYWGAERDEEGGLCPDMLERMPGEEGPSAIVLFAQNIEPLTRDSVATVLVHELGHLLGFDEEELVEGLGLR
jgi:predicted Zn-dependent protease with MMP-like domain